MSDLAQVKIDRIDHEVGARARSFMPPLGKATLVMPAVPKSAAVCVMAAASHERLLREDDRQLGSERGFGLVMAIAFLIFAGLAFWTGLALRAGILATIAAGFGVITFVAPAVLAPLNRLWFRFGLVLHKIVSPLILALLFFVVITPIGLIMRLLRRRPLPLGCDRGAATYWTARASGLPAPGSMRKQF